jgi:lipopolysaccharide export system protein LptC
MTRWYWLGGFAAAFVFVIAFLNPNEVEPTPLPPELHGEPDVYMEDSVITQFNEDGNIRYRLASAEITYFETDNLTDLEEPVLDLHQPPPNPPWNASAMRGSITQRLNDADVLEEQLFLHENVVLKRGFDIDDQRHIMMKTSALYIYPERQFAETDQAVIIETASALTKAVGFQGDLERGWMKLSSTAAQRVHIIVLPHQFK